MNTSTTQEGKGEPCIGKNTNSTTMNRLTKALQIVKYLEGIFNGNCSLYMGKGCDLHEWGIKLLANWDGFYEIKNIYITIFCSS